MLLINARDFSAAGWDHIGCFFGQFFQVCTLDHNSLNNIALYYHHQVSLYV